MDKPGPYCKLFIVCGRQATEDDIRSTFGQYGNIEKVIMPRNHDESSRGIAYVQFGKTSEAATALENVNGATVPYHHKPLKVKIASNNSELENVDVLQFARLFIKVPKLASEEEIAEDFKKFGNVSSVDIQKDHKTYESKGMAFVSFSKLSEAAEAFEKCDRKYKAIFAKPKSAEKPHEPTAFTATLSNLSDSFNSVDYMTKYMNVNPQGYSCVNFICCPIVMKEQVQALFSLIPGFMQMEYNISHHHKRGEGTVQYCNPVSAAYAVQRLNYFEYPPGMAIYVKPEYNYFHNNERNFEISNMVGKLRTAMDTAKSASPDLAAFANVLQEATKMLQKLTSGEEKYEKDTIHYCSVQLPPPQPLADNNARFAKRCFLVFTPQPPSNAVLKDIFCRFGNLVMAYVIPNKTVGYACYASEDSADRAIATLHGARVCGAHMKVLEAEEGGRKRRRSKE